MRNSKIGNNNNSPAVTFEAMALFHRNFQGLLISLSPIKPIILYQKFLWFPRNCFLSGGTFISGPPFRLDDDGADKEDFQ